MSWTYSGDPSHNNRDAVRFLVGDTIESDQLATDQEIEWALSLKTNIYSAAALLASGIATNFARLKISVKIGPISEEYGNRADFYANRAADLEKAAVNNISVLPTFGQAVHENTPPIFSVGITDHIEAIDIEVEDE